MTGFTSLFARTQGGGGLGANVGFVSLFGRGVGGSGLVSASSLLELEVSDTASIAVTESPVDSQEIATGDIARLALSSETTQLFNNVGLSDTASLSLSETISLVITGVTLKTASDTTSISVTDTSVVDVTLAVTDTASITLSAEDATVDVSVEQVSVSDTASITLDDSASLNVFTGVLELTVSDGTAIRVTDTASVIEVQRIKKISLDILQPRIELEIL